MLFPSAEQRDVAGTWLRPVPSGGRPSHLQTPSGGSPMETAACRWVQCRVHPGAAQHLLRFHLADGAFTLGNSTLESQRRKLTIEALKKPKIDFRFLVQFPYFDSFNVKKNTESAKQQMKNEKRSFNVVLRITIPTQNSGMIWTFIKG